jgi:AraC-like DNA-binding protein
MLMLPLPFLISFALGLYILREALSERELGLAQQSFRWLIALCILHSVLIGLVWGYGLDRLRPVLPVTASLLPVLVWLGFRALVDPQLSQLMTAVLLRLLPTLAVLLAHAIMPEAIDLLVILIFSSHAVMLWRMGGSGPDALAETAIQDAARIHRAIRLAALALAGNAMVDVAIFADYALAAGKHVPGMLSLCSVAILLALSGLAVLGNEVSPVLDAHDAPIDPPTSDEVPLDLAAIAARVDAFLRETRLYTQPDLTLSRIGRRLGMPARHVSTAINRQHGVNVSHYINSFRLDEACRLLAGTDLSVTEVHLEAGFQTKSNFNREFRRRFGQSPSEWRQSQSA